MTRLSTSFARDRELIIVDAEVAGRAGRTTGARLVLDTGAAATTLTPDVIKAVGYSRRDAYKGSTVHTAVGKERGFWIHVAELTVLDVTTPDFALSARSIAISLTRRKSRNRNSFRCRSAGN